MNHPAVASAGGGNISRTDVAIITTQRRLFDEKAAKLDRHAAELENNDWDAASDALNTVSIRIPNLRLDLLAARPIRQLQYRIGELTYRQASSASDDG